MELHAFHVVDAVADTHHDAVCTRRGDLEIVGDRLGIEGQRVVAGGGERRGKAGEQTDTGVLDR